MTKLINVSKKVECCVGCWMVVKTAYEAENGYIVLQCPKCGSVKELESDGKEEFKQEG